MIGFRSVYLDAQGAQANAGRGIARYVTEHAGALLRLAPDVLHSVRFSPEYDPPQPLAGRVDPALIAWEGRAGTRAPRSLPRIFHAMSPFDPVPLDGVWPPWARRRAGRTVVTLYDLIPLLYGEQYLDDPTVRAGYRARLDLVRAADAVLALSQVTADDAVDHLGVDPSRITVIEAGMTPGVAEAVATHEEGDAIARAEVAELRRDFVLYVGGADHRKNLDSLIAAWGLLPEGLRGAHQLVVACRLDPVWHARVRAWGAAAGVGEGELVLTGYVPDRLLAALYRACRLFVFPSLYEGFGLPILEAASCGAPVVASRAPTSVEVLGELRGTFDPTEPRAIADVLTRTLRDPAELEALRRRSERLAGRFSWDRVGELTLEAYERALERPRCRARPARRPRIALFTPWPPELSGIADYNRRLAAALAEHAEVAVVVGGEASAYADGAGPAIELIGAAEQPWRWALRPADRVVYSIGNSPMHAHAWRALGRRPGAVSLHDVRLTGLYQSLAELADPGDPDGWMTAKLRSLYGEGAPAVSRLELPWSEAARAAGILMSAEVQEAADVLLVHSAEAERLLRADRAGDGPPTRIVPFGVPEPPPAPADRRRDGPLVVAIGSMSPAKPADLVLEAFAAARQKLPAARLVLAGHALEAELERLRRVAAELGAADAVEVEGRLAEDRYWLLLAKADLGVQLRTFSNGEASAACADAIASRLPLLVSDIGWYAELPPAVAARVPVAAGAEEVGARIASLLGDGNERERIRSAQAVYAARNSFAAVAEAYMEALGL